LVYNKKSSGDKLDEVAVDAPRAPK
jgi:hypothetical protein